MKPKTVSMEFNELYTKSKKRFKWAAISSIVKGGVGFATISMLTLVLGPEQMGLVGILAVVYGLSETLVEFGIAQSIISRKKTTDNELSSIFWINQAIGIAVFLGVFLFSGIIASFYKEPELSTYIKVLSFIFIIEPLDLIFEAVLQKDINFPVIEKIGMVKSIFIFVVTVICLLSGLGIHSYLFGVLFGAVVDASLFTIYFVKNKLWLPRFHFRFEEVKAHYSFGFFVTARTFLNYIGFHFDEIIIGKLLGIQALGVYYFAKNLIGKIVTFLNSGFSKVTFPLFSKVKPSTQKFAEIYLRLTHFVAAVAVIFPVGLLLTPTLVPLIWGDGWSEAVFPVQIFCLIGMLQLMSNGFTAPTLFVYEKTQTVFNIEIVITLLRLGILSIAALFSINVVVIVLLMSVLTKHILLQRAVSKVIKITFLQYFQAIKIPLTNILISMLIYSCFYLVLGYLGTDIDQLIAIVVFILTYLYLFFVYDKKNIKFMEEILKK
ncbi:oligosaccharide flippase family protein [Candidatus Dojkabacteria bacterium]|nr:oligosaccharide flippase family protein [Candidatus Dojkabacteria bacterium]